MTIRPLTRNIALASGAGLAVVPLALAATPSFAAADCGEGTEVTAGICEKAYTTAGDYTFTAPSSVAKMSAVLVGGGQGGGVQLFGGGEFLAYGGGGGGVLFVDSVSPSAPVVISVGAGGAADFSGGGDTTVGPHVAGGGGTGDAIPSSGSPQENAGFLVEPDPPAGLFSGGGAGGTPTDCSAGAGLTASSVASGSSLFPALLGEPMFGEGGSCSGVTLVSEAGAGKGGDVYTELSPLPVADPGADGAVILRWTPGLPDTGVSIQPWLIGASVAGVLGGALLASGALRARRQGRHSA